MKILKVLYVHGFGSQFDPKSDKVVDLSELGDVIGFNYDYAQYPDQIIADLQHTMIVNQIDLVVGTSLGGYLAMVAGSACGVPYVAMNPAVEPNITLNRYAGAGKDFMGNYYFLSDDVIKSYVPIEEMFPLGFGIVLLDEGDVVIDPKRTQAVMTDKTWKVISWAGGSHRFEHTQQSIAAITEMLNVANFVDGSI